MQELQQLWMQLIDKWALISVRDRFVLGGFSVLLLLLLLYMVVVKPMSEYRQSANKRYLGNAELVSWIESNRASLSAPNTNDAQVANRQGRSLVAIVNESSRDYRLEISRVEPKALSIVRLWLDAVKFNDLIFWFGVLHEQYGIAIQDITIDQTDTVGVVRVNVTFRS